MITLFSDIDNTLIYSHRIHLPGEKIVVEYLNGVPQAFMTKLAYDFFTNSDYIRLVPTTTRTPEQYARLSDKFENFKCKYALVCNGGILLNNNVIDSEWLDETLTIAHDEMPYFYDAIKLISTAFSKEDIHLVKNIMLYFKTDNPKNVLEYLSDKIDFANLCVFCDNRKIYCFPKSINKGSAIKRFILKNGNLSVFAAGDSVQDISMLEKADYAIMPRIIANAVKNNNKFVAEDAEIFSDYICKTITKIKNSTISK